MLHVLWMMLFSHNGGSRHDAVLEATQLHRRAKAITSWMLGVPRVGCVLYDVSDDGAGGRAIRIDESLARARGAGSRGCDRTIALLLISNHSR